MLRDFNVELQPTQIMRDYSGLARDVRSFHEPLKRVVQQVMAPSFTANFVVGGRPAWEPLKESTIEKKTRLGRPLDILIETRRLMRTAGQLNLWKITREEATIQSLPEHSFYGAFHQSGTRFMAQRPWAVAQPEDADKALKVFDRWMQERASRRGWTP